MKLAVNRARATGNPAVFWLDEDCAHDAELIKKVNTYLADHNTDGLELLIQSPVKATRYTLERIKAGQDTISVTGNVLQDYTDLFPILELGTRAKDASIVPCMKRAAASSKPVPAAPPPSTCSSRNRRAFALGFIGRVFGVGRFSKTIWRNFSNPKAKLLGETLDDATTQYLLNNKSPSRKVNELDNRGSHFYLALYWAQALAQQESNEELREKFAPIAEALAQSGATKLAGAGSIKRKAAASRWVAITCRSLKRRPKPCGRAPHQRHHRGHLTPEQEAPNRALFFYCSSVTPRPKPGQKKARTNIAGFFGRRLRSRCSKQPMRGCRDL